MSALVNLPYKESLPPGVLLIVPALDDDRTEFYNNKNELIAVYDDVKKILLQGNDIKNIKGFLDGPKPV